MREPIHCAHCDHEIGHDKEWPLTRCSQCNALEQLCMDCLYRHRGKHGGCAEKAGEDAATAEIRSSVLAWVKATVTLLQDLEVIK